MQSNKLTDTLLAWLKAVIFHILTTLASQLLPIQGISAHKGIIKAKCRKH